MQQHQDEGAATQEIPLKVYRSDERLTVAAPMPGLMSKDIDVEVRADGRLILHGALRGALKGQNDVLADEWNPGPYHREFALPNAVDGEMANVTYNNGVIVVVMPLAERTTPAHLALQDVNQHQGERAGNEGHPVRATEPAH